MSSPKLEMCFVCGYETGRAGRCEDSMYLDTPNAEVGPLCEDCFDALRRDDLEDALVVANKTINVLCDQCQELMTPEVAQRMMDEAGEIPISNAQIDQIVKHVLSQENPTVLCSRCGVRITADTNGNPKAHMNAADTHMCCEALEI